MRKDREVRRKWLHLRVNETEFKAIEHFWKQSNCGDLSDYARRTLLKKPVVFDVRNASADAILSELIRIKNELKKIASEWNNITGTVKNTGENSELKGLVLRAEISWQHLAGRFEEIKTQMIQTGESWLPK